jgi:glutathione S-transferase|tara:strand:- start:2802 stop:3560 length:759 start_codon:yes stop_codon:yes gene_type:complete
MHYSRLSDVGNTAGPKLVLTKGMPGPWGELVKAILQVKNVTYTAVAQYPGKSDEQLKALSGQTSAPVLIDKGACIADLKEIILAIEKNYPSPLLLPSDELALASVWEFIDFIAGPDGFAWNRRLMMFIPLMKVDPPLELINSLAAKYGYSEAVAEDAPRRVLIILARMAAQLNAQAKSNQRYMFGNSLTALDITWAVFCSMLLPLPETVNAMPQGMRESYTLSDDLISYIDPILIEHRDYIYKKHLILPLDY